MKRNLVILLLTILLVGCDKKIVELSEDTKTCLNTNSEIKCESEE